MLILNYLGYIPKPSRRVEDFVEPEPEPAPKPAVTETPSYTGSSSNKFFTPVIEEQASYNYLPAQEPDVDPMQNIDKTDAKDPEKMELKDAIEKYRETKK